MQNSQCISTCLDGYYYNNAVKLCQTCAANCDICLGKLIAITPRCHKRKLPCLLFPQRFRPGSNEMHNEPLHFILPDLQHFQPINRAMPMHRLIPIRRQRKLRCADLKLPGWAILKLNLLLPLRGKLRILLGPNDSAVQFVHARLLLRPNERLRRLQQRDDRLRAMFERNSLHAMPGELLPKPQLPGERGLLQYRGLQCRICAPYSEHFQFEPGGVLKPAVFLHGDVVERKRKVHDCDWASGSPDLRRDFAALHNFGGKHFVRDKRDCDSVHVMHDELLNLSLGKLNVIIVNLRFRL